MDTDYINIVNVTRQIHDFKEYLLSLAQELQDGVEKFGLMYVYLSQVFTEKQKTLKIKKNSVAFSPQANYTD
jgi:hypothetical protein